MPTFPLPPAVAVRLIMTQAAQFVVTDLTKVGAALRDISTVEGIADVGSVMADELTAIVKKMLFTVNDIDHQHDNSIHIEAKKHVTELKGTISKYAPAFKKDRLPQYFVTVVFPQEVIGTIKKLDTTWRMALKVVQDTCPDDYQVEAIDSLKEFHASLLEEVAKGLAADKDDETDPIILELLRKAGKSWYHSTQKWGIPKDKAYEDAMQVFAEHCDKASKDCTYE